METTVGTALEDDDREDSFTDEDSYAEAKDALRARVQNAWKDDADNEGVVVHQDGGYSDYPAEERMRARARNAWMTK